MKKRSLVSAIAMLVVSAIVLTSATFAWFAASNSAAVSSVEATVTNSEGAIYLSASNLALDADGWKSTLTSEDIANAQDGAIATAFSPVSISTSADTIVAGSISEGKLTTTDSISGKYTHFTVYVKSASAGTVTITPTFSRGADFCYAMIKADSTKVTTGAGSADSYAPIVKTGEWTVGSSAILKADVATEGDLGDTVSAVAAANSAVTLAVTDNSVTPFDVYVWAEGQDSNCTGAVNVTTSLSLALAFAAAS